MSFTPTTLLLISLSYRYVMNRKMITLFVILARSTPMAFPVKSVKLLIYSCSVLSGCYFLCRLLAACASVPMGEYTFYFFLISCQLLAPTILFDMPVDLAIANLYSLLFVSKATFSICNKQSAMSMFTIILLCLPLNCHIHVAVYVLHYV